jgi:DNA mismatch repair protein MutL
MEIRQLSSDVVDKIAAGEVVERPAHLLKELLENSIDAGADRIDIEVQDGGRGLVVTDNGRGVSPEDLPLVFSRHATSKIAQAEDLWNLNTFGFRGEAVASISAVSQLDFTSLRQGADKAYRLHSNYGELSPVMEASHSQGTRVQVSHLFDNIPARLKFLKSDAAELAQIKNVVKAMALQYPQVEWRLKSQGKLVFLFSPTQSSLERACQVFETPRMYENTHTLDDFKAQVIFSSPENVVKVSRQIWVFVQNRWVQDRSLQAAVMEAYRSLLMHGQYPLCFVSLTCPPDQVDVNIHPTKSQVKFVDSKKAFRTVYYALREALETAPWLDAHKAQTGAKSQHRPQSLSAPQSVAQAQSNPGTTHNPTFMDSAIEQVHFQKKNHFKPNNYLDHQEPQVGMEALRAAAQDRPETCQIETDIASTQEPARQEITASSGVYWSQLQVIGQVDLTYIVAQDRDKLVLVDQHAAHERVAFERLMSVWKSGQNIEAQNLLIPLVVDLDAAEVEALISHQQELQKMGIEIEAAGPDSVAISSRPTTIREKALVEALRRLADEVLNRGDSFALEKVMVDIFATMACHSVVRAGQALSQQEMEQLLKDMDQFPLSGFCPHGRSVSLEFPFAQLEKDFGRRG